MTRPHIPEAIHVVQHRALHPGKRTMIRRGSSEDWNEFYSGWQVMSNLCSAAAPKTEPWWRCTLRRALCPIRALVGGAKGFGVATVRLSGLLVLILMSGGSASTELPLFPFCGSLINGVVVASCSGMVARGSIELGSGVLATAQSTDFHEREGILINHAGVAVPFAAPTKLEAIPVNRKIPNVPANLVAGSTFIRINEKIRIPAGQEVIGAGVPTGSIVIREAQRLGSVYQITMSKPAVASGPTRLTFGAAMSGVHKYRYAVAAVDRNGGVGPSSEIAIDGIADRSTYNLAANYVALVWNPVSGASAYVIWISYDGGLHWEYFGSSRSNGQQISAYDYSVADLGQMFPLSPFWVPTNPTNNTALADWLVTQITHEDNDTHLVLALPAVSAATNEIVVHDDTAAFSAWITQLNRSNFGGMLSRDAKVRLSDTPPAITRAGFTLKGQQGALLMPAGAANGPERGALSIEGQGDIGPARRVKRMIEAGSKDVLLETTDGLSIGQHLLIETPAPIGDSVGNPYTFISPIVWLDGSRVTVADPSPYSFPAQFITITIAGLPSQNETIQVTVSGDLAASLTLKLPNASDQASCSSPVVCVAFELALAIDMDPRFKRSGVTATSSGNRVDITTPADVHSVWATSPSSLVRVGTTAGATVRPLSLLSSISVSGIGFDGQNLVGTRLRGGGAGGSISGIYGSFLADAKFDDLTAQNFSEGSGMYFYTGYRNTASHISIQRSGDGAAGAAVFARQTLLTISELHSQRASGFGPQIDSSSWIQGVRLTSSGAHAGRGLKISSTIHAELRDVAVENAGFTCFDLGSGSYRITVYNLKGTGCRNPFNSGGVVLLNQWNRENEFYKVSGRDAGNGADILIGPSDIDNRFFEVSTTNKDPSRLINRGGAAIYGLNGRALR